MAALIAVALVYVAIGIVRLFWAGKRYLIIGDYVLVVLFWPRFSWDREQEEDI